MPKHYCSTCGYAVAYAITKPASCPKCSTVFAAPAAVPTPITVQATRPKPKSPPVDDQEEENPPVPRRQMRPTRAKAHRVINTEDDTVADETQNARGSAYDPDDDTYDPREARRLARELIATIDRSSIRVVDDTKSETKFRFGDIVPNVSQQGQS